LASVTQLDGARVRVVFVMLKIDLAELMRQPGKQIVVDIDEAPPSDDDVTYVTPSRGRITIANTGDLVLVRGAVKVKVLLECGRCLGAVREPVVAEIEEQYSLSNVENARYNDTQISIVADEENEVPPGLMNGSVMDLGVVIRQAVILNTPLGPLCSPDCRGFCPKCGKNRNDPSAGCQCEVEPHNRPLAVLKELYGSASKSGQMANGADAVGDGQSS